MIRIAINGLGRVGRTLLRQAVLSDDLEVVGGQRRGRTRHAGARCCVATARSVRSRSRSRHGDDCAGRSAVARSWYQRRDAGRAAVG